MRLSTETSAPSTLDEEFERFSDEIWLLAMPVLSVTRAASTLADDDEIESEIVLISARTRSTLAEELE
jgi:hypothetical protein